LYGCEVWSLTLREERRLRVLENRVLRRIFGPKRDERRGEASTVFWWGNLKETPCGRPTRRWRIILRWIFRKWDLDVWTGLSWFRIGTGGGHL